MLSFSLDLKYHSYLVMLHVTEQTLVSCVDCSNPCKRLDNPSGVQEIYRQQELPDQDQYDKKKCLKAIAEFIEEHYPQITLSGFVWPSRRWSVVAPPASACATLSHPAKIAACDNRTRNISTLFHSPLLLHTLTSH